MKKNVLLISNTVPGSGYGDAVAGISEVLSRMAKEGEIRNFSNVNINKPTDTSCFRENTVAIFVLNPKLLLVNKEVASRVEKIIEKSEKSYLSIVWETTKFPEDWDNLFKSTEDGTRLFAFDGFLAPSVFVYTSLKKVTDLPVFYYPHYIKKREQVTSTDKDTFRILYVGQYTERKGLEDAVTAATLAFHDKENVELVVKYNVLSQAELNAEEVMQSIIVRNSVGKPKFKAYSSSANLPADEMENLYKSADILLFPSRGEGFGLPPCISMSYGIPVVYVPWSATAETCDNEYNYCVDYALDTATGMAHFGYTPSMYYAKPHMCSLVSELRRAYDVWTGESPEQVEDRARTLSSFIDERYGLATVKKALQSIIMNEGNNISAFPYTSYYM